MLYFFIPTLFLYLTLQRLIAFLDGIPNYSSYILKTNRICTFFIRKDQNFTKFKELILTLVVLTMNKTSISSLTCKY